MDLNLKDMFMLGIEGDTYKELLDIAKKQGKSVNEVTSDALRKIIEQERGIQESKSRRMLNEG